MLRRQNEALRRTLAEQTLQLNTLRQEVKEKKKPKLKVKDLSSVFDSSSPGDDIDIYDKLKVTPDGGWPAAPLTRSARSQGTGELEMLEGGFRDSRTGRFASMDAGRFSEMQRHSVTFDNTSQDSSDQAFKCVWSSCPSRARVADLSPAPLSPHRSPGGGDKRVFASQSVGGLGSTLTQ
jgi:hypothetical protein